MSFKKYDCLNELLSWKKNLLRVLHNRKGNLGYGDCPQHLAYSTESQVVGFGIQASVMESAFR